MENNYVFLQLIITTFCNGVYCQNNLLLTAYTKREFLDKATAICSSSRNLSKPLRFLEAKEHRPECTFCLDDADCGKSHACCFEEDDTFQLTKTTEYECISYRYPEEGILAYNMIVDDGHCKHIPGHVPCRERNLSVLGSLHPVSSTKTGNVYKNEICAQCNNDADSLEAWGMFFSCKPEEANNFYTLLDIINIYGSDMFNIFDCVVTLRPPGWSETNLRHSQQCFKQLSSKCSGSMPPLYGTGLTKAYISSSCERDFFNPCIYNDIAYKNIYCALCNFVSTPNALSFCKRNYMTIYASPNDFIVLLQYKNPIASVESSLNFKIPVQLKNSTTSASCRQLHCPTGKQKLGTGECKTVYERSNVMALTVLFEITLDQSEFNALIRVVTPDTIKSLYGDIVFIGADTAKSTRVFIGKLFNMGLVGDTIDETILKVDNNIEQGVVIHLDGTSIHANITLVNKPLPWYINESLVVDFDHEALLNASKDYATYKPLYVYKQFFQQKQMKRLTTLEYGRFYSSDQVELNQDEFVIYKGVNKGLILYNRYTQTYLMSNAFYLIQNKEGSDVKARVALEDSGFELTVCNTSKNCQCHLGDVLSVLLIVNMMEYYW